MLSHQKLRNLRKVSLFTKAKRSILFSTRHFKIFDVRFNFLYRRIIMLDRVLLGFEGFLQYPLLQQASDLGFLPRIYFKHRRINKLWHLAEKEHQDRSSSTWQDVGHSSRFRTDSRTAVSR